MSHLFRFLAARPPAVNPAPRGGAGLPLPPAARGPAGYLSLALAAAARAAASGGADGFAQAAGAALVAAAEALDAAGLPQAAGSVRAVTVAPLERRGAALEEAEATAADLRLASATADGAARGGGGGVEALGDAVAALSRSAADLGDPLAAALLAAAADACPGRRAAPPHAPPAQGPGRAWSLVRLKFDDIG